MSEVIIDPAKLNTEDPVIDNTGCCYDPITDTKIYNCKLADDNSLISGFTEDGKPAKYYFDKKKWFYGKEISRLNLVTFADRTPEEMHNIAVLGGKARQKDITKQRSLNDIAKSMLTVELAKSSIQEILGDSQELIGDDRSAGSVMIAKMIQTAMAGSFKAAEFVRDTAGYKPKNEVDISADIMTDEDRSLLAKIDKRLTG